MQSPHRSGTSLAARAASGRDTAPRAERRRVEREARRAAPPPEPRDHVAAWFLVAALLVAVPLVSRAFEFHWSKLVVAHVVLALAGALWAWRAARGRQAGPRGLALAPTVALAAWGIASLAWAHDPYRGVRLATAMTVAVLAYLFVTANLEYREPWLRRTLWAAVLTGAAVAVHGALQASGACDRLAGWTGLALCAMAVDTYGKPSPGSTFGFVNFAVEYVTILAPVTLALALPTRRGRRAVAIAPFAVMALYIVLALKRTGFLAFLAGLAVLAGLLAPSWLRLGRRRPHITTRRLAAGAGLAALLAGALVLAPPGRLVVSRFASIFSPTGESERARLETWKGALRLIAAHPIVGVGIGNFGPALLAFTPEPLMRSEESSNTIVEEAHNEFLNLTAEGGVVALVLFLWLLVGLARATAAAIRAPDPPRRRAAAALAAGLVALLVTACVSFPLQRDATLVAFGVFSGLLEVLARDGALESGWRAPLARLAPGRARRVSLAAAAACAAVALAGAWEAWTQMAVQRDFGLAVGAQRAGDTRGAIAGYDAALREDPGARWVLFDRGFAHLELGELPAAIADVSGYLAAMPDYGRARAELAAMLLDAGRLDDALAQVGRARRTYPIGSRTLDALECLIRLDHGESGRARELAARAQQRPGNAMGNALLAFALLRLGDPATAAEAARWATKLDPSDPRGLLARGLVDLDSGSPAAVEELQRGVALLPTSIEGRLGLALALRRARRNDEAAADLGAALAQRPDLRARVAASPELAPLLADVTAGRRVGP